jgi:hypothetical protein
MSRLLLALALAGAGCVRVVHVYECDGGTTEGGPPPPIHVQALVAINLGRASTNLVGPFSSIVDHLGAALTTANIVLDQYAVVPLYGSATGAPELLYGYPASGAGELSSVLQPPTLSGDYDQPIAGVTAEQYNPYTIGGRLDTATLPPELTDGSTTPFFNAPADLFLFVTIQPSRRLCDEADPACAIGGADPVAAFSAVDGSGNAQWLKLPGGAYPAKRVYQVAFDTKEGETPAEFQARCGAIPGFPKALLDVMEPSPTTYYGDLAKGLGGQGMHAEQLDLCEALGAGGAAQLVDFAGRVAQAGAE